MEYQIGDFSRISRLSVKTIRYYHEYGLLNPTTIDDESGYRYYDESCLERASVISELKALDFSLKEIKDILDNCSDDSEIVDYMIRKSDEIKQKMKKYEEIQIRMKSFIEQQKETKILNEDSRIVIKDLHDVLIASIRFKGRYDEAGKTFGRIFKACGRSSCGAPLSLYYQSEYMEDDADIESCVPVMKEINKEGINSRVLKGGRAITIIHRGPYETIGMTYKVITDYINKNNMHVKLPSREMYIKGPGVILPGNPRKFLTEIQMILE